MSITDTLREAASRFSLDDLSQAYSDAEGMRSIVSNALHWRSNTEDQDDALTAIDEEVEGNMLHDITEAIGNGWADDGYEEDVSSLLEALLYSLEVVISNHEAELAEVTA